MCSNLSGLTDDWWKKYYKENVEEKKEYRGNKNKSDYPSLIKLLKMTQGELIEYLIEEMHKYYKPDAIVPYDGFIYVRGEDPICLTSHMDTTPTVGGKTRVPVVDFYEEVEELEDGTQKHTLISPQGIGGDDRCGVWSILKILETTEYRPYIVFCEDEEIGCVGSGKFIKYIISDELKNCKFLVEIDRRGNDDCVFYNDDNTEFHDFIEQITNYTEAIGICSDICNLSESTGVASVNLSSGYYHEHTIDEIIVVEETIRTITKVIKLIEEARREETPFFEYKEKKYDRLLSGYYWDRGYNYSDWDDDNFDTIKDEINISTPSDLGIVVGYFMVEDKMTLEQYEVTIEGESKMSCLAKFFMAYPDYCFNDIVAYDFEEQYVKER